MLVTFYQFTSPLSKHAFVCEYFESQTNAGFSSRTVNKKNEIRLFCTQLCGTYRLLHLAVCDKQPNKNLRSQSQKEFSE